MTSEEKKEINTLLSASETVVIKLGTATLTPHIDEENPAFFSSLAGVISKLQQQGKRVLIVSSGAVGFGRRLLADKHSVSSPNLVEKQALASLGQSVLINRYRSPFAEAGLHVAQILVSSTDFTNRAHYNNLRHTLNQLLSWNIVPIINENDAVATRELRFGDNDTLSASIAGMYPSAFLIILTSIDGFYMDNKRVDILQKVTETEFSQAGKPGEGGSGGMFTKLAAGRRILASGQLMAIASGDDPQNILQLLNVNFPATWFIPGESGQRLSSVKRWLLHNQNYKTRIVIDKGAEEVLKNSSASLLAVGVVSISEDFSTGDIAEIFSLDNVRIGRGITAIDSSHVFSEASHKKEVIHRDSLLITEE